MSLSHLTLTSFTLVSFEFLHAQKGVGHPLYNPPLPYVAIPSYGGGFLSSLNMLKEQQSMG